MAAKNEELLIEDVQNIAKNLECYSLSVDGYKAGADDQNSYEVLQPSDEAEGKRITSGDQRETPREALKDFFRENGEELASKAMKKPGTTYINLEISDCRFDKEIEDGEIDNYHAFLEYDPSTDEYDILCIVNDGESYEEQEWWAEAVEDRLEGPQEIGEEQEDKAQGREVQEPSDSFREFADS